MGMQAFGSPDCRELEDSPQQRGGVLAAGYGGGTELAVA